MLTVKFGIAPYLGNSRIRSVAEGQARQVFTSDIAFTSIYDEMDVKERRHPYLGEPPKALFEAFGSEEAALKEIDRVAEVALKNKSRDNIGAFTFFKETEDGKFYTVGEGKDRFRLKVYKPDGLRIKDIQGIVPAVRTFVFMTAQGAKDCAKFQAANPSKKWLLTEFIDSQQKYDLDARGTAAMADIARENALHLGSCTPPNFVSGIRIDCEGITDKADAVRRGLDQF